VAVNEIRVDYEKLDDFARLFGSTADEIEGLHTSLTQEVEDLYENGWRGEGSNKFYAELDGEVLPAVRRLHEALSEAQTVLQKAVNIYREAEQEASRLFEAGGSPFDLLATGRKALTKVAGTFSGALAGMKGLSKLSRAFGKNPVGAVINGVIDTIETGDPSQLVTQVGSSLLQMGAAAAGGALVAVAIGGTAAAGATAGVAVLGAVGVTIAATTVAQFGAEAIANATGSDYFRGVAQDLGGLNEVYGSLDKAFDEGTAMAQDVTEDIYDGAKDFFGSIF
jgi:WXG100 family type VII secretion target